MDRAKLTGGLEERGGLADHALLVALRRDVEAVGIGALHQLAGREARGCGSEDHAHLGAGLTGDDVERGGEQRIAGSDGGGRSVGRPDRVDASALRRAIEHVVVDERRDVDELGRRGREAQ